MEVNRTEKITFRCTALEKAALAEQAARCGISTSEYCRTLALGGRPKERYTEEERELFREIARLKGTLQRLNNYFGGRQYREVFEENHGWQLRGCHTLLQVLFALILEMYGLA